MIDNQKMIIRSLYFNFTIYESRTCIKNVIAVRVEMEWKLWYRKDSSPSDLLWIIMEITLNRKETTVLEYTNIWDVSHLHTNISNRNFQKIVFLLLWFFLNPLSANNLSRLGSLEVIQNLGVKIFEICVF